MANLQVRLQELESDLNSANEENVALVCLLYPMHQSKWDWVSEGQQYLDAKRALRGIVIGYTKY